MFKELLSGIDKFFNRKEFVLIVIIVLIAFALLSYTNSKSIILDGMTNSDEIVPYSPSSAYSPVSQSDKKPQPKRKKEKMSEIAEEEPMTDYTSSSTSPMSSPTSSSPADLLPADSNSDWAKLNPSPSAGMSSDLLRAGYNIGIDTVGQTLRNANLQLRSDPIIPKQNVGPWMQSTIEPDLGRVPLEIGSSAF